MGRTARIIGGIAITLAAIGILANLKDVQRYIRISLM
jgi:hypothetical protein